MFHWICPECGQEIAPGVKECPVCEPQATAPALVSPGPSVALAPAPEVAPAPPVAVPLAPVLKQPVPEPPVAKQPVVAEPVQEPPIVTQQEILLQPKTFDPPKPRVVLDAIPVEARTVVMPDVPLGTSPVELPDPLVCGSTPERPTIINSPEPETFADRLANLAEHLHGERIPYRAPRIFQESAAPRPRLEHVEQATDRKPVIIDLKVETDLKFDIDSTPDATPAQNLLAPPPSMLLLAEPQPPAVAAEIPSEEVFRPRPAEYAARSQQPMGEEPAPASAVRLPDAPRRVAAPGLAPLENYSETADRLMRFVDYATKAASGKALPTVTLPGPALPRELMSLQAAGLVPIRRGGRRGETAPSRSSSWTARFVVVGILLTGGLAATYTLMPGTTSGAPPRPSPQPAPEPPVSARSTNSLARYVEVTGIRFMEVNKKPQIHYLVVNHSSASLGSVTVFVTLRPSGWKPGQPPLSRFSFRSPILAGYEAKEMASPIERVIGPLELPDWQDLRADVDVQ